MHRIKWQGRTRGSLEVLIHCQRWLPFRYDLPCLDSTHLTFDIKWTLLFSHNLIDDRIQRSLSKSILKDAVKSGKSEVGRQTPINIWCGLLIPFLDHSSSPVSSLHLFFFLTSSSHYHQSLTQAKMFCNHDLSDFVRLFTFRRKTVFTAHDLFFFSLFLYFLRQLSLCLPILITYHISSLVMTFSTAIDLILC